MRLSHSQINKFLFCGEAWRLHYKEGYRSKEIGSALVFGSAIGKTFEFILNAHIDNTKIQPNEFFDNQWNNQKVNDSLVNLKGNKDVVYSKYDTDWDLITQEEITCISITKENEKDLLAAWYSLRHKGHLMIDSFIKNFLPLVEHVYSTEELIELGNAEGDSSIGFSDTVVKLKDYDKPVIIDFKTAAREYDPTSVVRSVQLSQYMHVLGEKYNTRLAGYCVFLKSIVKDKTKICTTCGFKGEGSYKTCNNEIKGKRCNGEWKTTLKASATMQLIIDEIPQRTEDFIIGNIENVCASIKTGIYTKNVGNCFDNGWGRPCEFVNKCWNNKEDDLVKVEVKIESTS